MLRPPDAVKIGPWAEGRAVLDAVARTLALIAGPALPRDYDCAARGL